MTQFGPGMAKKVIVVGDSGTVVATVNLSKPFPEDAVCDDQGRVYVTESNFADGSSIIERIETNLSLTNINTSIKGPEGPSLDAAGNMYVNTRLGPGAHTGVWKFPAATLASPPNNSPILAVLPFTFWGEGTGVLIAPPYAGQLAASGSVNVFRADVTQPLPVVASPFITRPGTAVGIAISDASAGLVSAGDVAVSYSDRVELYNSSGALKDATYGAGMGFILFSEFDALANLLLVAASGQIWKIHPDKSKVVVNPTDPIASAVGIAVCKREEVRERMTGGGSVGPSLIPVGAEVRHGFQLHCLSSVEPNNLEVNWPRNIFHLEKLTGATCYTDPTVGGPAPPPAGFNTYEGNGEGRYNGISGYKAKWKFTDAGEPGTNDSARIVITDSSGTTVVLIVDGKLDGGNHQAH